jgi:hypothetical protein
MVKQKIIGSDAKPVLWIRLKRNTLVMWRIIIRKYTSYDEAIDVVTDLREGGDVRGSPLAVIMGLVGSQGRRKSRRD